jgi:hypothetical protein
MKVTPESIQKIYVLIGAILGSLAFVPDSIKLWFSESGTAVVMGLVSAIFAVIQFLPFRTNKPSEPNQPAELKKSAPGSYWIPFMPLRKAA